MRAGTIAAAILTSIALLAAQPLASQSSAAADGALTAAPDEVVAVLDSEPYYYNAHQEYSGRSLGITPVTTTLHIELSDEFLMGSSGDLTWTVRGIDSLSGSAVVDREAKSVDIGLPSDFYDRASATATDGMVGLTVASQARSSAPVPSVPARFTRGDLFGWSSYAAYRVNLRAASADSKAAVHIPLSKLERIVDNIDSFYWANTPEGAVVSPSTTLRFRSDSAIWQPRQGYAPSAYLQSQWRDWTNWGRVPIAQRPVISDDSMSVALPFSQMPGTLTPFLDDPGILQFSAGSSNFDGHGTIATTIAAVGTDTSITGTRSTRLADSDRYSGSVADAAIAFPNRPHRVYLASGAVFADALSAGPAAVHNGAPLLLIAPSQYGASNYLAWARPAEIVVLGGQASTPDAVVDGILRESKLDPQSYSLRRDAGADRYAASLAISAAEFPDGASTAFLASGAGFADALTSIPAASSQGSPVILIRGDQSSLDGATLRELERLGVSDVVISGGPASVSKGIEEQLRQRYPTGVARFGGATRFEVAESLNATYFPEAETAYLATGSNFPDALTGGVLAGIKGAPLLLSRSDCLPASTWERLSSWSPSKVTLLGGVNSLSSGLRDLPRCN